MKRLYRWKSSLQGERPKGVELGVCYEVRKTADERGVKGSEYDLIDSNGKTIARYVPIKLLEECEAKESK